MSNNVTKAMENLLAAVNMDIDNDAAEQIASVLEKEHRTIQQKFMRVFVNAMDIYKDSRYDARNSGAIKLAKEISETDVILPYI